MSEYERSIAADAAHLAAHLSAQVDAGTLTLGGAR